MMNVRQLLTMILTTGVWLLATPLPTGAALAGDAQQQKAVLVTGASTGIGRNIAERLAAEGHFVYAGARKPGDIEALSRIENIQGVRLDARSRPISTPLLK